MHTMADIINLIQNASPVLAAAIIALLFKIKSDEKEIERNKEKTERV